MIVKDEAPVVERCLASVSSLVDWWVVCDTGSTDGTQDVVRAALADKPGLLLERPWVDFAHNRQEALDAARGLAVAGPGDYALSIDADNELVDLPEGDELDAWRAGLVADGYFLPTRLGATRYQTMALVRLDRPWRWRGVLHEHLDLDGGTVGVLDRPGLLSHPDGARARDPETYRRDVAVLRAELARLPGDPRTEFYLAQSLRDAGEVAAAREAYLVRAANPAGWGDERWYALFQAAACAERLGHPASEVVQAYLTAYAADPSRAEPLLELSRLHRERDEHEVALLYSAPASRLPRPGPHALFVDEEAYAWRALDEVAVSCYWTGRHDLGRQAAAAALAARPDDERLRANLAFFGP